MTSDRDRLVHAGSSGRREAFDEIVARHGPMVYGVALRVLRDHHHAEDVVQLTFIELTKHPETSGRHLGGWLHGIAMNVARKYLRSRVRSDRREAARGITMVASRSEDGGELREEIDAALGRLPADLREAVILHYLENRDYEESARLSGCSEDALRKRTQRGLRRLHDLLAGRGIACGLDPLAAFLIGESAVNIAMPEGLLSQVAERCHGLLQNQAASTASKTVIKEVIRSKTVGAVAVAVVVGGALGLVGVLELGRRWTAAPAVESDLASELTSPGWSRADRARFRALSLKDVATVASSESIFRTESHGTDGLIPPYWGEFTARGIPFRVDDPQGGSVRNVIVLQSPKGDLSRRYPRSVSVPCGVTARAIHLLSGVSGWGFPSGFPRDRGKTVTMIVRLKYAGGEVEDHPLLDGVHFTYYYTLDDVPASKRAIVLKGRHQVRHLVIAPGRKEPIEQIAFLKGQDDTGPVVMAVTVEVAEKAGSGAAAVSGSASTAPVASK